VATSLAILEILAPFSEWLGSWEGEGHGHWEAEQPFRYRERLAIEAVPTRAILRVTQRTTVFASGDLSHTEMGFLRLFPDQSVELVVADPTGYSEIHTGRLQGGVLDLVPHSLSRSPTSRPLHRIQRRLQLDHDSLHTTVAIAVGEETVAPHVESWLHRVLPGD
jgi:hypothetical protein